MNRVQRLEQEITELTRGELTELRRWFQAYDAAEWDKQIEADILAGKLQKLAEKAIADHEAGITTEI